MELVELDENSKDAYQSFVKTNGCFLQDWDWGDFQRSIGKEVQRFIVRENGNIILTAQVLVNAMRGKKYFSLPYGPVRERIGNFDGGVALEFFLRALAKKYPQTVFIRIEPQVETDDLKNKRTLVKSLDLNPHQTLILDLKQDLDKILAAMHNKTRYNIKVAEKHGVEVVISERLGKTEAGIFDLTARRAGVRFQDPEYFDSLLNYFSSGKSTIRAALYSATAEGQVIASNLMIFWHDTAVYLFGGSGAEKRNFMAPYALHWQAIQDAKEKGIIKYDFWGVETDSAHPWYGFSKFKLGFGGEVIKYAGTYDYLVRPAWYNAYRLIRKLNRIVRK